MKTLIAIPTLNRKLTAHFGHCEQFALIESEDGKVKSSVFIDPPAHQPGIYPRFLAEAGVTVVLAGGMGAQAQQLFSANGIVVRLGIREDDPEILAQEYLDDILEDGDNQCTH